MDTKWVLLPIYLRQWQVHVLQILEICIGKLKWKVHYGITYKTLFLDIFFNSLIDLRRIKDGSGQEDQETDKWPHHYTHFKEN